MNDSQLGTTIRKEYDDLIELIDHRYIQLGPKDLAEFQRIKLLEAIRRRYEVIYQFNRRGEDI